MTPLNHRDSARDMAYGVGITLILFAVAIVVPLVGLASVFLMPLPVLVYRLKLGRAKGTAVAVIAFVAMVAVTGSGLANLFPFLERLILGFVIGECFVRRFTLEKTMLVTCGTVVIAGLMVLFFYSFSAGVGISEFVTTHFENNLMLIKTEFEQAGTGLESMQVLTASMEFVREMLKFFPGFFVSGTLVMAWITLLIARPILKRLNLPCPDFTPLIRWRAPKILLWLLIGCVMLSLIPAGSLKLIGLNCLIVVFSIYFFQGIAIMAFFFARKNVPTAVRWVLYILTTIYTMGMLAISLGLFDIWLNVRRLDMGNPTRYRS